MIRQERKFQLQKLRNSLKYDYEFILRDENQLFTVIRIIKDKLKASNIRYASATKNVIHVFFSLSDLINLKQFLEENKINFSACYIFKGEKIISAVMNHAFSEPKKDNEITLEFI